MLLGFSKALPDYKLNSLNDPLPLKSPALKFLEVKFLDKFFHGRLFFDRGTDKFFHGRLFFDRGTGVNLYWKAFVQRKR